MKTVRAEGSAWWRSRSTDIFEETSTSAARPFLQAAVSPSQLELRAALSGSQSNGCEWRTS